MTETEIKRLSLSTLSVSSSVLVSRQRTVAELPGHLVASGLTVPEQREGVAAVPAVMGRPEQSVQTEDQVQAGAAGEGVEQVHGAL